MTSDPTRDDAWEKNIVSFSTDDCAYDWDVADVPVDSHVDFRFSHCQGSDPILELCSLANVTSAEDANGVFIPALQNLTSVAKCYSVVVAKSAVMEHGYTVEETVSASLAVRILKKSISLKHKTRPVTMLRHIFQQSGRKIHV